MRDHGNDFCSKNVSAVAREPNVHAIGPDDDSQVTFSCSGRQGALLYLPFPAEREDTVALGDFGKWMVKNIDNCMRLAEDRGLGVSRMEDIILVTGRHLAKSWARAVFSDSRGGAQASFCVRVSGDSVVRLEERNISGAQLKFGPNGQDPIPENQCIFIRGFHVVRILNIWPKLRAMAGPPPDPHGSGSESDMRLQLIGVPADTDHQDPLHTLMEYIADQTRTCDMILVHDDDLKCIEGAIPPIETLQPDALMRFFRAYAPTIHQCQCENSLRTESDSRADVVIATVATLSQNVFEVSPLHLASERGDVKLAQMLLEHGADANARDKINSTPLHWASPGGHVKVALVLLDHGADANSRDEYDVTPLHWASDGGHVKVALLLLENGADARARDNINSTPLHCTSRGGHVTVARVLLDRRADANSRDKFDITALHWASERGHVELAQMLLEHGADANAWNNNNLTSLDVALRCLCPTTFTGFPQASSCKHLEVARVLLEYGAVANAGLTQPQRERIAKLLSFILGIIFRLHRAREESDDDIDERGLRRDRDEEIVNRRVRIKGARSKDERVRSGE